MPKHKTEESEGVSRTECGAVKTVVIACRTIEEELGAAMARTGTADLPVRWLESGLHNTPNKLTDRLQEEIDAADADRVLLGLAFCGNSLAGIRAKSCEVIVPRADDCISVLLGSVARRAELNRTLAAFYLTQGWLRGERNVLVEYRKTVEEYGEETAEELMEMIYGNYRTLCVLDCGIADASAVARETAPMAEALHLQQRTVPATLQWLEDLLTGPWDENRFLRLSPGGQIRSSDLTLPLG